MTTRPLRRAALGALLLSAAALAHAQQTVPAPAAPRALPTQTKPWKGDFDGMVKRRHIRVLVPDALEDEDMMEMLNAGLLEAIVVDDWKARIWAQVLPKIKVNDGAVLRSGGLTGWAVRKESPKLAAILNEFHEKFVKKHGLQQARIKQYSNRIRQLKDPTGSADWKRFEETLAFFRKYGEKYRFDPLMLAAQGYQESGLDQNAKSHVGAIGIMQIMPATGAELKVDINVAESNIHGGAKYMDQLMTRYFPDANFSEAKLAAIPNVLKTPAPSVAILDFNPLGTVLAVRPCCHNDHYWQVFFDTNRALNDAGGEGGYPAPETRHALRKLA